MVPKDVGSGPRLGQGESVDFIAPFSLNVTMDRVCLVVMNTQNLERNVGRSLCLNFKGSDAEWVVFGEQVVG